MAITVWNISTLHGHLLWAFRLAQDEGHERSLVCWNRGGWRNWRWVGRGAMDFWVLACEMDLGAKIMGNHGISWEIMGFHAGNACQSGWKSGDGDGAVHQNIQELVYKPWANGELTIKHIIEHQDNNWFTMWCPSSLRLLVYFIPSNYTI